MRKREQQRQKVRIAKMNLEMMYLDNAEMKRMFKISDSTLGRWRDDKIFPFKLIRGRHYYSFEFIKRFMDKM